MCKVLSVATFDRTPSDNSAKDERSTTVNFSLDDGRVFQDECGPPDLIMGLARNVWGVLKTCNGAIDALKFCKSAETSLVQR